MMLDILEPENNVVDINLREAIGIATLAHGTTKNKYSGELYINHPLRIMFKFLERPIKEVSEYKRLVELATVAILHDVFEDTDITATYIMEYTSIPMHIIEAVIYITRRKGETYTEFINKIKENDLAREVKIEDINDNLSRVDTLKPSLKIRYEKAKAELMI